MKKFKKIITLTASMIFIVSSLSGCGSSTSQSTESKTPDTSSITVNKEGYPVASEPITLEALAYGEVADGDWNNFPVFDKISEQTGVDVNFQTIGGDGASEKLNLILTSNDHPDIFFSGLSSSMITKYADMGLFIPLEGLIEEYAPNLTQILEDRPEIRKAITMPDGHIYALPAINPANQSKATTTHLVINKTWLDNLGLDIPTTTDEFVEVLRAFQTEDPNGNGEDDEIPFSYEPRVPYNIWNGDTGLSGAFGVVDSSQNLMVDGDQLLFTPIQDGYKDYIKWTRDMYLEGLVDREIFTQDHNQYMAKVGSDYLGAYLTNGPAPNTHNEFISIPPLKGPNGDQMWSSLDFSIDMNRAIISANNPHPEATMRYLDSFYEPLNSVDLRHGVNVAETDGKFELVQGEPGQSKLAPGNYAPNYESQDMLDNMYVRTEADDLRDERYALYAPHLNPPMPLLTFLPDESKEISTIATDIQNFVQEKKAKWTTGQTDIDEEWDAYIEQLNAMGLERYVEIYQTAYDRYLAH